MSLKNRLKIYQDYKAKKSELSGFPVEIGIEMTNRCNLKCIMCAREQMTRPIGDMDMDIYKKIIVETKDFAEMIYLHGDGEPLLHKNIIEAVSFAKSFNLKVGLSSNATLLSEKIARDLINSKLDYLILAVDGATKETYEKIRVNGHFEVVRDNIINLLKLKKELKSNIFVLIQFIEMQENKIEAREFLTFWKKYKPNVVRIKPYVNLFGTKEKTVFKMPCFYLWRSAMIDWDGTFFPCCVDTNSIHNMGNIRDQKFADIWNSNVIKNMRMAHLCNNQNSIEICNTCDMHQFNNVDILASTLIDGFKIKKFLPYIENFRYTKH